jgi:hypothetical protein
LQSHGAQSRRTKDRTVRLATSYKKLKGGIHATKSSPQCVCARVQHKPRTHHRPFLRVVAVVVIHKKMRVQGAFLCATTESCLRMLLETRSRTNMKRLHVDTSLGAFSTLYKHSPLGVVGSCGDCSPYIYECCRVEGTLGAKGMFEVLELIVSSLVETSAR